MLFELSEDTTVLFNSLSGALFVLDRDTAAALQSGDEKGISSGLKIFKEDKCIYETEQEEIISVRKAFQNIEKAKEEERIRCYVVPTYSCNITCSYCPATNLNGSPISPKLTKKVFDAIDSLEEYSPSGKPLSLMLDGGEPLSLHGETMNAVHTILNLADERDFRIGIRTNGITLHQYAQELSNFYIDFIDVPVDGVQPIHDQYRTSPAGGTFHRIQQGIDTAIDCGLSISLRVRVSRKTLSTLPQMADFIMEKGWNLVRSFTASLCPQTDFSCYRYRACMPDYSILPDILELYHTYDTMELFALIAFPELTSFLHTLEHGVSLPPKFSACDAGKKIFSFDPYGTVYPCNAACMMKIHPIGMYFPHFEFSQAVQQWQNRNVFTVQDCLTCAHCFLCGGGCTLHALDRNIHEPQCKPIDETLQMACREYLGEDRAKESAFIDFSNILIPKKNIKG